jgi:hypothetical protein
MSFDWAHVNGELGPCSCCGHIGIRFTDHDLRCFGCLDNDDPCCRHRLSARTAEKHEVERVRQAAREVLGP